MNLIKEVSGFKQTGTLYRYITKSGDRISKQDNGEKPFKGFICKVNNMNASVKEVNELLEDNHYDSYEEHYGISDGKSVTFGIYTIDNKVTKLYYENNECNSRLSIKAIREKLLNIKE